MMSMVSSLGHWYHRLLVLFRSVSDYTRPFVCVHAGDGGMRVGPQYQAVVPDFDPGENGRKTRSLA